MDKFLFLARPHLSGWDLPPLTLLGDAGGIVSFIRGNNSSACFTAWVQFAKTSGNLRVGRTRRFNGLPMDKLLTPTSFKASRPIKVSVDHHASGLFSLGGARFALL